MADKIGPKTWLMLVRKYGWHTSTCAVHNGPNKSHKCDCGWNELQPILIEAKEKMK